jgi:hypothetical protein
MILVKLEIDESILAEKKKLIEIDGGWIKVRTFVDPVDPIPPIRLWAQPTG